MHRPHTPGPLPELLKQIRSAALDSARAVQLQSFEIDMGLGQLHIEDGWIVPALPVEGQTHELTFVGRARFRIVPPNEIEADQLELFTGERSLDVAIDSAVMVVGDPGISNSLLGCPSDTQIDADSLQTATDLFDPDELEQITLGQFVPYEMDELDRDRSERIIERSKRKGRGIQTRLEDLGDWNTWIKVSHHDADGKTHPGGRGFEPTHYSIDATVSPGDLRIEATAGIDLTAEGGGWTIEGDVRMVAPEIIASLCVTTAAGTSPGIASRRST